MSSVYLLNGTVHRQLVFYYRAGGSLFPECSQYCGLLVGAQTLPSRRILWVGYFHRKPARLTIYLLML